MAQPYKTRGIVLRNIKYGERGYVSTIYTEIYGIQAYMIRGAHSPKSKVRFAHIQPLSQVDFVASEPKKGRLHNIRELHPIYHYQNIPTDMVKGCIAMFVNEVLNLALHEESADPELFHFIVEKFRYLDSETCRFADFHLDFIFDLSSFLGFKPRFHADKMHYFDLMEGVSVALQPDYPYYISGELFEQFLKLGFDSQNCADKRNKEQRNSLLDVLIAYYKLHLPGFKEPKSLAVLRTLF